MNQTDVAISSPTILTSLVELPQLPVSQVLAAENRVSLAKFNPSQLQRVQKIAQTVSIRDSNSVMGFGVEPQRKLNGYIDKLLEGLRTSDLGLAGELTIELATSVKAIRLQKMKVEAEGQDWVANTFGRLPMVGKYASALRYFQLTRKEVLAHLRGIEEKAEREMGTLRGTNSQLDQLVDATLENICDLEIYLAAGQVALEHARVDFATLCEDARASRDMVKVSLVRDAYEQINAFEARLARMDIAYTRSVKAVPEIRITQEAARISICGIMDTVLFDLPSLKQAILQVAAVNNIARATKANDARRELTRQIGSIGSDALADAFIKAKQSQGTVLEDVVALSDATNKLLETLNIGLRIDDENRQKRAQSTAQLSDIRAKLLVGVQDHAERMLGTALK